MASGLHEYSTFSARLTLAVSAALLTFGVALMPVHDALAAKPKVRNAEDLLIVDCLLPGQVRKLGAMANYMSARRPIRTTQADCEIRGGEYVAFDRANYQTALKVWMDQANAGSADAQNYVGEIYLKGLGTAPDYDMAAVWLKKAVAQGNNRARINLGYLYEQGLGVEKDLTRALNLYREASGIQDDDLLFASTVQVQLEAKDAEIGSLREDVATSEAESQRLRRQVDELQGQLRSRKQALQGAQRELQATQSKLAEARKATGADFSAIDRQRSVLNERENEVARLTAALKAEREASERRRAEVEQQLAELKSREDAARTAGAQQTLAQIREETDQLTASLDDARQRAENVQTQLASNQSQLEIERQQYEARIAQLEAEAAGRKQEDWELMKLLETQLAARESEVRQQQTQIAVLEQQTALAGGSLLAAAPTLEIIDPPLAVTRGRPAAMLQRSAGRQDLTGKVSNPQAIASITVNGTPVVLGGNGLFRASIDVQPGGSVVKVAATDRRGGSGELEFLMVPQADGAAASRAPTPAPAATAGVPAGVDLGRYHAIVIGNNSYANSHFQPLQSAVNDATAVAEMLRNRYGFKTNLLLNASRFEILSALNDARETLGPNDNLLVYYAGHGELSADGEQGYWIPVDGQPEVA
ncbi:MAG: caspase family protein, partial [Lysobacteraceae bacterium]